METRSRRKRLAEMTFDTGKENRSPRTRRRVKIVSNGLHEADDFRKSGKRECNPRDVDALSKHTNGSENVKFPKHERNGLHVKVRTKPECCNEKTKVVSGNFQNNTGVKVFSKRVDGDSGNTNVFSKREERVTRKVGVLSKRDCNARVNSDRDNNARVKSDRDNNARLKSDECNARVNQVRGRDNHHKNTATNDLGTCVVDEARKNVRIVGNKSKVSGRPPVWTGSRNNSTTSSSAVDVRPEGEIKVRRKAVPHRHLTKIGNLRQNSTLVTVKRDSHVKQKPHEDIDSKEPYARDILAYLKEREMECFRTIAEGQESCCHPDHRIILVDWLIDVQVHLEVEVETLHLGVALLDEYLRRVNVSLDFLQLVGITCLFVACKMEEIYLPQVSSLCELCAGVYSVEQVLCMERRVLFVLEFCMLPTATAFLDTVFYLSNINEDKTKLMCQYFLEIMLLDQTLHVFLPSHRAAAALYLALIVNMRPVGGYKPPFNGPGFKDDTTNCQNQGYLVYHGPTRSGGGRWSTPKRTNGTPWAVYSDQIWTEELARMTGYASSDLIALVRKVVENLKTISSGPHQALFKKYCQEKYNYICLEPILQDPSFLDVI